MTRAAVCDLITAKSNMKTDLHQHLKGNWF